MAKKPSWETSLLTNKQGAFLPCLSNVVTILAFNDDWHNVIAYDAFAGTIVKRKPPPIHEDYRGDRPQTGDWIHEDTLDTAAWITREYNIAAPSHVVAEAIQVVAQRYVFHPVRDWLNELPKWDRRPRIDDFFIRLAGAKDTPYVRAVTKNFFLSAVARIREPGCQVDTMLILEGPQGVGKSSIIRILAGDTWFLDTSFDIGAKDGYLALRRKWIVEMSELDSLSRAELSRTKAFLSSVKDSFRPPYGKTTVDNYRQCVFIGSNNPDGGGWGKDITGARRFQPIDIGVVDLKGVREERLQVWAEALARYLACEKWHIRDPRLLKAAAQEAELRRQTDPWETHAREWLGDHLRTKKGVTTEEILTSAIGMPVDRQGRAEQIRAAHALRAIGWTIVKRGSDDRRRYFPDDGGAKTLGEDPVTGVRKVVKKKGGGGPSGAPAAVRA